METLSTGLIEVHYHLLVVCLADIEALLEQNGFHLDNRLMYKIRAPCSTTRKRRSVPTSVAPGRSKTAQKVFMNRYRKRDHGCQDDRPDHGVVISDPLPVDFR